MIGLGSNRLSVCRRGGMSVTQAGRGGMEWLAGGRMPSWASPYSAQATAALKAQFPTQWPTIRDYGFAHPEIVGYMNAYAPEDAKIAYSLVEGIGTRWIVGDGQAYIDTGLYAQGSTEADAMFMFTGTPTGGIFGSDTTWLNNAFGCYRDRGFTYGNAVSIENGQDHYYYAANTLYRVELRDYKYWRNNEEKYNFGAKTFTGTTTMTIFARKRGSSIEAISNTKFVYIKLRNTTDNNNHEFVPFKRNGAMGMIDLLTGTFYGNANSSGSFTESIETSPS